MIGRATLADRLAEGCRTLGLDVSEPDQQRLLDYLEMLARWNTTYNLTAVRDPGAMLVQHLLDCLAIVGPLRRWSASQCVEQLLDVGSGAGLPGCVIAIVQPELHVTCVDSVGKKAAFIRQAAGALGLRNLRAEHARVEALTGRYDLITARAFADLGLLVSLTRHLLHEGGAWLAMKGKLPTDELQQLPGWAQAFHVEQLSVPQLGAERSLAWLRLRDLQQQPSG